MISVNLFVPVAKVALQFYEQAFDAISTEENLTGAPGTRHAKFKIGEDRFALAEENPDLGSKSAITLGGVPMCIQLYVTDVEKNINKALAAGATLMAPSTAAEPILTMPSGVKFGNVMDPFGFVWSISSGGEVEKKKPAKAQHRWSKAVSEIDFFVDHEGAKAICRWQKRNEMLIKKGAVLKAETPLNKDGSLGFAAKFTLQLREMNKDKIKDFVTTEDIVLKSVNEVGNFLYFAGTNSWLILKDEKGKTIDAYSVVK